MQRRSAWQDLRASRAGFEPLPGSLSIACDPRIGSRGPLLRLPDGTGWWVEDHGGLWDEGERACGWAWGRSWTPRPARLLVFRDLSWVDCRRIARRGAAGATLAVGDAIACLDANRLRAGALLALPCGGLRLRLPDSTWRFLSIGLLTDLSVADVPVGPLGGGYLFPSDGDLTVAALDLPEGLTYAAVLAELARQGYAPARRALALAPASSS
jgi:hypothetical protein